MACFGAGVEAAFPPQPSMQVRSSHESSPKQNRAQAIDAGKAVASIQAPESELAEGQTVYGEPQLTFFV